MSRLLRRASVLRNAALAALIIGAVLGAVSSTAGIQGSGLRLFAVIGPVTAVGEGSISVGGTQYTTGGAQVEIDGESGSASQLQPGDVVSIGGEISLPGETSPEPAGTSFPPPGTFSSLPGTLPPAVRSRIASSVAYSSNVRGAVTAVDVPSSTVSVLGQTVRVTSDTVLDPAIRTAGLQSLQNGTVVEASGFRDASGNLVATRLGTSGSNVARVVGVLHNLDPSQQTFTINALTVSYGSAVVQGTLAEGAPVTVQGTPSGDHSALSASLVDLTIPPRPAGGTVGQIQGLITDLASDNYFEVDGQPVAVNAQTHLNLHVPLGLDVEVKVRGEYDSNGTLVAHMIQTKALH